jgi:GrpB-like predicted nucleotidyltransferase (UPF0157 family)
VEKNLRQRIEEAIREDISIVPYDPEWPGLFETEADFLRRTLPSSLIRRIEHFGSTAVPALAAKPIIDILIEVVSLEETQKRLQDFSWSRRTNAANAGAVTLHPQYTTHSIKSQLAGR